MRANTKIYAGEKRDMQEFKIHSSLIDVETPSPPVLRGADFIPQILACLAAFAILIQTGVNLAFSAVLLPELMSANSDMNITQDEASWIASIVTIATTAGSLVSGPLIDRFGRKLLCSFTCIPITISWVVIAFTTSVNGIYCGRLLAGFGAGLSAGPIVYVSEVVHQRWRSTMLCLVATFVSFGILLTCILCLWLDYVQMSICFAVLSFSSFIITWPIPESPHWLLRNRSEKKAGNALHWLYRREICYQHELKSLLDSCKTTSTSTSEQTSFIQYFSEYKKTSTLKPIGIVMVIFIFQQISGAYIVIFYAVNILHLVGGKYGNGISEYTAFALLGVIRFAMSICTAFASRKCGRRPVSIVSGLGMAGSALIAAIYISSSGNSGNLFQTSAELSVPILSSTISHFTKTPLESSYSNVSIPSIINDSPLESFYSNVSIPSIINDSRSISTLVDKTAITEDLLVTEFSFLNNTSSKNINFNVTSNRTTVSLSDATETADSWVPPVCVLVYVLFSSMGVLVIPWTLIGELPPISVRGSSGGFMMAFSYIMMFVVVKAFPYLLEITKIRGMFYIFSATSFLGALHVFFFLPETQGRSFQEIEAYFK